MLSSVQLNAVVRKNIEAMGGIDAWSRGQQIKARAIASVFEPDGSRSLLEQQHVIAIDTAGAFSVLISNDEPIGKSTEQLTNDGKVIRRQQIGDSVVPLENQEELDGAKLKLSLEAHAMTGAAGLLQDGLSLRYVGLERKGGRLHHKIEATGQVLNRDLAEYKVVDDLLVAWVDAETYLFDRLLLRYQLPSKPDKFGYIAVNVGDYQRAGRGLSKGRAKPAAAQVIGVCPER